MESFFIDKIGNNYDDDDVAETEVNENEGESSTLSISKIVSVFARWDEETEMKFITARESGVEYLFNELPDTPKLNKTKSKPNSKYSVDDTYLITSYKSIKDEGNVFPNINGNRLKDSELQPGLEKKYSIQPEKSKKALQFKRKKLAEKTKGKKWFDMEAKELTEELKTDFELLKMRSVLNKGHVYKKNDITRVPKYFHVGRIVESPADFYGGRIPKSQRKKTMVEELLADAEFKKYQKKKFKEIVSDIRWKTRSKQKAGKSNSKKKKN